MRIRRYNQRPSLCIVQQVDEFGFDVAVVDVEGCDPGPVGADHRFQVLVAVAQVQPDMILARFVTLQAITFGVTSQARRHEVVCDPVDAGVQLRVRPFPAPPDEYAMIGKSFYQCREYSRQVEASVIHETPRSSLIRHSHFRQRTRPESG